MNVASIQPVYNRSLIAALLSALETVPGAALLTTPKVHLFTAGPTPITPNSTVANFTEATFAGYASISLPTLSALINLPNNTAYGEDAQVQWIASTITGGGQTILGYWVDNGTSTLYLAEYFPTPIPISIIGDNINLQVVFGLIFSPLY